MASLTRGPLPARVYWRRRVMVLGTALLLVFGIARVLVGGSDGASSEGSLTAAPAASSPTTTGTTTPSAPRTGKEKEPGKKRTEQAPVLAEPEGECADEDVAVTPAIDEAVAGRRVLVVLELRTALSPACTWRVSPETLTVKITSGSDDIWSSRQCPRAIPTREVVVRREVSTKIGVRWSGRRSDADCTRFTDWAMPGWYHVASAAYAGEPSDVQFQLTRPKPQVIVRDPKPDKQKTKPRDKPVEGPGRR